MSSSNGIIIKEPPRTLITCAYCQKPGPLKQCSACKCLYYCNDECQKADGEEHETICKSIQTIKENDTEILQALREELLLDKQKHEYECAICLETKVTEEEPSITLECCHCLCCGCLRKWETACLEQGKDCACPVCRAEMPFLGALFCNRSDRLHSVTETLQSTEERDEICSVALKKLESILQVHPGMSALLAKGKFLVIMERYEDAVISLTKSINTLISEFGIETTTIEDVLNTQPQDTIDLLGAINSGEIEIKRLFVIILLDLIGAYIENGDYDSAEKLFSTCDCLLANGERRQQARLSLLKVTYLYRTGKYEEALSMVQEVGLTRDLRKISAICYKEVGDFDTAVSMIAFLYYHYGPVLGERQTNEYLEMWSEIEAERIKRQSS